MRCAYPLMLDVSERLVVVVGGGSVAARKVKGLLEAGAGRVRCVAVEFAAGFPQSQSVERIVGRYAPRYLEGAALVFAATDDPEVNAEVVRDARSLGVWVNRADADDQEPGDFSTPAVLRVRELVVTVSAGGSPALAALVRDGLAGRVDARWGKMVEAMRVLRPRIVGREDLAIERRRAALRELASDQALEILQQRGVEGLWSWVKERSSAHGGGPPL